MICKKCNVEINDNSIFCMNCGAKCNVEEEISEPNYDAWENEKSITLDLSSDMQENAESYIAQSNNKSQDENSQHQDENIQPQDPMHGSDTPITPEDIPAPQKKKFKKKFFIIPLAAILVIAIILGAFGRTIFFALAPEHYVAYLIDNTLDSVSEDFDTIEENIFGFAVTSEEDFTAGLNVEYFKGEQEVDFDLKFANDTKKESFLFKGTIDSKAEPVGVKAEIDGYLNDENIGIMLPGFDKKFLTVPSKDFGKKLEDSDGVIARELKSANDDLWDVVCGLDLSYSHIREVLSSDTEKDELTRDYVGDNLIVLLKNSEISDRKSVNYKFDGETVSAKEITITVNSEDFLDFVADVCEDIKDDKTLCDTDIMEEMLDKTIDSVRDLNDNMGDRHKDMDFIITEYEGKIVCMVMEIEDEDGDITLRSTSESSILNGIMLELDNGEETIWEMGYNANWYDEDEVIFADFVYKNDNKEAKLNFDIDYTKDKWTLKVSTDNGNDKNNSRKYSGKCSKDDGFLFEVQSEWDDVVNGNSMTYDEWKRYGHNQWRSEMYDEYILDYLNEIYYEKFYYDYDSFDSWYDAIGEKWDVADDNFEAWLRSSVFYDMDDKDIYNNYTITEEAAKAGVKVNITLKDSVDISIREGKNEDILDWQKEDFEELIKSIKLDVK